MRSLKRDDDFDEDESSKMGTKRPSVWFSWARGMLSLRSSEDKELRLDSKSGSAGRSSFLKCLLLLEPERDRSRVPAGTFSSCETLLNSIRPSSAPLAPISFELEFYLWILGVWFLSFRQVSSVMGAGV